jgi:acyl-CoA reductase-like NAD-dependent aldehyde dehydrogenase
MTPDMRICKEEIFGPVLEHAEGRRIRHAYGQVTLDPAGGV